MNASATNSDGGNGVPAEASGGTGCTGAAIFTATAAGPFRDAGSASNTRTAHNRSPVVLSRCCGSATPAFTASKSLIGSTPSTYAPAGNTSSNRTGTGNCTATTTSRRVGCPPRHEMDHSCLYQRTDTSHTLGTDESVVKDLTVPLAVGSGHARSHPYAAGRTRALPGAARRGRQGRHSADPSLRSRRTAARPVRSRCDRRGARHLRRRTRRRTLPAGQPHGGLVGRLADLQGRHRSDQRAPGALPTAR